MGWSAKISSAAFGKWVQGIAAIPLPFKVLSLLGLGFELGLLFPHSPIVRGIYLSGTYFPRFIVTMAALLGNPCAGV